MDYSCQCLWAIHAAAYLGLWVLWDVSFMLGCDGRFWVLNGIGVVSLHRIGDQDVFV
jgi:hypothetical protein